MGSEKGVIKEYVEAICVFIQLYSFYMAPVFSIAITYYLLFCTSLWPLVLCYFVWMYFDRHTPSTSGRSSKFIRNLFIWRHVRNYFPQKLVKTSDIDVRSNHLFCFFPHGILATAGLSHFTNDTSQVLEHFPGVKVNGFTLNINFYIPFLREVAMGYGLRSVSKESMLHILNNSKGRLLIIYPGGSAEAAKSQPGKYNLALKNRKGFIKIAIVSGTNLVPVVSFGETDLFEHKILDKNSFLGKVQTYLRSKTGVAFCLFSGRGVLGLLPYRKPVTAVVGKPIIVTKNENPTLDEINNLHQFFIKSLIDLFESHKSKYIENSESIHLSIED